MMSTPSHTDPSPSSKRYSRLLASVGQTKTKNEPKDPSASASGNDTDSGGAEKEEPKKRKAAGGAAGGKGGAKGKPAKKVKVEVSPEDEASDGKEGIVRLGAVNPKDIMVEAVKTNDDDGDEVCKPSSVGLTLLIRS